MEIMNEIKLPSFAFYEFVSYVIPGSLFLALFGVIFPNDSFTPFLLPESIGGLGVHLFAAYVTGHLLQVVGNFLEDFFWIFTYGRPSDWPVTKDGTPFADENIGNLYSLNRMKKPKGEIPIAEWRELVGRAISLAYKENRAFRLHTFSAHYLTFRAMFSAVLILFIKYLFTVRPEGVYILFFIVLEFLFFTAANKFSSYYASELFVVAKELAVRNKE
jgi:hypothetical protein